MKAKVYLSLGGLNCGEMDGMPKLLVTGASGLLGNKIVTLAENSFQVIPTDVTEPLHPNAVKADITDETGISQLFSKFKPDLVIHTASETNVDRCETEKERAWKINVVGTRNIAEACRETNAKLVCISTDYVFDGEKGLYVEEDAPNPIDFYGLTKLEGEKQAVRRCKNCAVLRTSVLYGRHPWKQDFATWVINKLRQNQEITVVDDHFNSPTLADNLAEMALEAGERDLQGVFHTSGIERISRYDFARRIALAFDLNSVLIKPIKMNELKAWIAKRPKDSSLNTGKVQKQLKTKPLNINEGLSKLKEEMKT
jgi:dTDP-4-dehydrorhamnose reductase